MGGICAQYTYNDRSNLLARAMENRYVWPSMIHPKLRTRIPVTAFRALSAGGSVLNKHDIGVTYWPGLWRTGMCGRV